MHYLVRRKSRMSLRNATCHTHLGRVLASSRTCCRMQLHAATKPKDANFVIRKKVQPIKVVTNDPIGTLPFETLPAPPRALLLANLISSWFGVPSVKFSYK